MNTIIETIDLCKIFKDSAQEVCAVNKVNLTISAGEFTAIVGPSGSGKTTLLNLIGGLDAPTSGSIFVEGRDISLLKEREITAFRLHHIGFVFQAYNLIPVLTQKKMSLSSWNCRAEKNRKLNSGQPNSLIPSGWVTV